MSEALPVRPLKVFVVAGEHSGDALGAKLMSALKRQHGTAIRFEGVGGELMEAEGLKSLFPMSDVAVMGPGAILKRLAPIVRRVYRTVDVAVAVDPDVVVIIDAPEFTHPIAKRIRRKRPSIPIINYVSPTVWAWRPGRAKAMRPYVDHLLALLPFEPAAHERLGGPPCTYVGHPLAERIVEIRSLDPAALGTRIGIESGRQVLLVLPGSRRSEVQRLLEPFRETVALMADRGIRPEIIIPVVASTREMVSATASAWPSRPHLVEGDADKWMAFRMANAALAASGTVTLELAVAGTPMVIAYKVEAWFAKVVRALAHVDMAGLPNLILGDKVFPEFIQETCTPPSLAGAVADVLADGEPRRRQLTGLAQIPARLAVPHGSPSEYAAEIVLRHARQRA